MRAARQARGLTAAALANRVGVTENAIRKIEAGDSKEPRFSTGLRIAHALGIEPGILVDDLNSGEGTTLDTKSKPDLAAALRQIRAYRNALQHEGVQHLQVFGSVARGNARSDSDVDVIIDTTHEARFSLFNLAAVSEILQHALNRRVDVLTRRMVAKSPLREEAERDAVSAF
jgi:predicted nucleotidyltransferase/DNA-binding Xre family transcriptional regulator